MDLSLNSPSLWAKSTLPALPRASWTLIARVLSSAMVVHMVAACAGVASASCLAMSAGLMVISLSSPSLGYCNLYLI